MKKAILFLLKRAFLTEFLVDVDTHLNNGPLDFEHWMVNHGFEELLPTNEQEQK